MRSNDAAQRLGCGKCRSWMAMTKRDTPNMIWLNTPTISFDDLDATSREAFRPSHHIFVSQRAVWSSIDDDLPKYERFRDVQHC